MNAIYVMNFSCFTHLQILNLKAKSENQYVDDNTIQFLIELSMDPINLIKKLLLIKVKLFNLLHLTNNMA